MEGERHPYSPSPFFYSFAALKAQQNYRKNIFRRVLSLTLFNRVCESDEIWQVLVEKRVDLVMVDGFGHMYEVIAQIDQNLQAICQRTRNELLSANNAE